MASVRLRVPFSQIPEWVIDYEQAGLSANAVRLYGILARYGNSPGSDKTPGRRTLAARCGVSIPTIDRARQELIQAGALTEIRRGARMTNIYILENGESRVLTDDDSPKVGVITHDVGESSPVIHDRETLTERVEAKASTSRPDHLWDKLVEIFGAAPVMKNERARWNAAHKQLREAQVTPEQLSRFVVAWKKEWPNATLTPMAIVSNWTVLSSNGKTSKELKLADLTARIQAQEGTR